MVDFFLEKLSGQFFWSKEKERFNVRKHGIDFETATQAFYDPQRVIIVDEFHSDKEQRYFCLGKVGGRILTVRFTRKRERIRIFGTGFWRKGVKIYAEKNSR